MDDTTLLLVDTSPSPPTEMHSQADTAPHGSGQPATRTLHTQIANLSDTMNWAIRHSRIQADGLPIAQAIASHQGYAVSDGSWKEGFGTAAYLVGDLRTPATVLGEAVNLTPPGDLRSNSQRSELSGLLGVVLLTETIC